MGHKKINELNLEGLIGRSFKKADLNGLKQKMKGKVVLITGAGGSIGSEISYQLSQFEISKLILIDHSEFNLYSIHDRLLRSDTYKKLIIIPRLVNICDKESLQAIFSKYHPDFIFHAAAYKHVHLVEFNPYSGIINNILGTQNLLECAKEFCADKFVLISTDKAVRPTNLMGATKRICELLLVKYAVDNKLNMSAVRFGNVAGSSGSLIPKLYSQIKKGTPLTITDARMTRFFMLIPEAVELVLKSSETSKSSDIVLLNMGRPIKIIDIAKKLIAQSIPHEQDYPIEIIGIRPGEKLFEEISLESQKGFEDDAQYLTLKDGDRSFKPFTHSQRSYDNIYQAVSDILFYAKNHSKLAVSLVWETIKSDFIDEKVDEKGKDSQQIHSKDLTKKLA